MKYFLTPLFLASVAMAANVGVNLHNGGYNFDFATGDAGAHTRSESASNGIVTGSYSYIDPNGDLRSVQYNAGPQGFQATGDTGVDKKTAAAAAAIAALAPKAPPAPEPAAPPAPLVPVPSPFFIVYDPVSGTAQWSASW